MMRDACRARQAGPRMPPRADAYNPALSARRPCAAADPLHSPWINTMPRCDARRLACRPPRRLVLAAATAGLLATCALPLRAQALQRRFPRHALRGELVFGAWPAVLLNGQPARLAPGSRVRDEANRVALPGALAGGRFLVHYTVDSMGLLQDIWVLRPDEAARQPWPRTPAEAAAWFFDEGAQVWLKPAP